MPSRVQHGQVEGATSEENRRASAQARSRRADEGESPEARACWTSRAAASAKQTVCLTVFALTAAFIARTCRAARLNPPFRLTPPAGWRGKWGEAAPSVEVVVRRAPLDRSDGQPMFDIEAFTTDPRRSGEVVARAHGSLSRALALLADDLTEWAAIEHDLAIGDEV